MIYFGFEYNFTPYTELNAVKGDSIIGGATLICARLVCACNMHAHSLDPTMGVKGDEKANNVFQRKLDEWSGQHKHLVYGLMSDVRHDSFDP